MANRAAQTVAPSVEPVSLDDAKLQLRIDHADEDGKIAKLITAARVEVERFTGRQLITATWRLYLDQFPGDGVIRLPHPPLQSVTSIVYTDTAGASQTWASSNYDVDTDSEPGRITLAYNKTLPSDVRDGVANPIAITFVAGYGDAASDVPDPLKGAIEMLLANWYEHREPIVLGVTSNVVKHGLDRLLWSYRLLEVA